MYPHCKMKWTPFCLFLFPLPKTPYVYHIRKTSHLFQIEPTYSLFDYNKSHDIFHYNTKYRRNFKNKYFKQDLIDNHHIIPRQFQNHPLLQELHFDVACSKNIYFLPTRSAKHVLQDASLIYHNSHPKYNTFVAKELQRIHSHEDKDKRQYEFVLFFMYLSQSLEHNDPYVKSLFRSS
jgi:hypothetical protein